MAEMDHEPAEQLPPSAARADGPPPSLDAAVGSVAQEAALFLRALREHGDAPGRAADQAPFDDTPPAAPTPAASAQADEQPDAHPAGSTCTWCPLCRTVDLVRTMSPETLERLADLAAVAATAVAELAVQARHGQSDEPTPPRPPQPAPRPTAQAVPVTDDPEEER